MLGGAALTIPNAFRERWPNTAVDVVELDPAVTRLAAEFPSVAAHARAVVQTDWEHELTAVIAERMGVDPLADPFPEVLAGAAFAAFRSAIRRWGADGGRSDFGVLLDESLDVLAALAD